MYIRRLVKAGAASFTAALPKDWIISNDLKKGDMIYIKEISKNKLLVSTEIKEAKPKPREMTLNIENKKLDTIHRELTSAYINNYSTINIIGKDLYRHIAGIRSMLNNFVALEIAEQTSTKIVAKDMLDLKEVSIDKTIRRMDIIVRSILKDLISADKDMSDSINYRDSDVNRLYFLLFKIVKTALRDPNIAKAVEINNYVDALSIWYLILNLESIADNSKEVFLLSITLKKDSYFEKLVELFKDIEAAYLNVMKSYYNDDKMLADKVASNRKAIFSNCTEISEKNKNVIVTKITENLREIENFICNISRITIDKE
jgi:phosphate uptake regulator